MKGDGRQISHRKKLLMSKMLKTSFYFGITSPIWAILTLAALSSWIKVILPKTSSFLRSDSTMSNRTKGESDPRLIVVAPTFYGDSDDVRYHLGLEACRQAAKHGIDLLIIDASPSESVRSELKAAGLRTSDGHSFVTVIHQSSDGKKGAAQREGISIALDKLAETEIPLANTIIGLQELEKVDLVQYWRSIADYSIKSKLDIVIPKREDDNFRRTYPIEQYHSEHFANSFFDTLGKQIGMPPIDWTFGPVSFRASLADQWLNYDGEIWDAEIVPIVDSFVQRKAKIDSFEIPYFHPTAMKEEEEQNPSFNEKRLFQLNFLSDTLGERMRELAKPVS